MKRVGVVLLMMMGMFGWVRAQAPVTSRSVMIEAVESAGDSRTTNNWRTYDGSYSKTKVASRELAITVRNMSAIPGEFTIEWYFVGKPTSGSSRFLYDKGEKTIALNPSAFEKFSVESKELTSRAVRDSYYYYGYNYKSGDRPDGWIIRARVGNDIVRVKASSPQLEQLEKDKAQFERFVKKQKQATP